MLAELVVVVATVDVAVLAELVVVVATVDAAEWEDQTVRLRE